MQAKCRGDIRCYPVGMRFWISVFALTILIVNCGCQRSPSSVASNEPPKTQEKPPAGPSEDELFEKLVKSQVEVGGASLVRIVDRKAWPSAPVPEATVIAGIARHPAQEPAKSGADYDYFSFVLLAAGNARAKQPSLIPLGLVVPDLGVDPGNPQLSVDITPIKIREDEYAFGTRNRVGSVGNKGGNIYELINLYRFHDAVLKEIFRDVVWEYSKYSEGNSSCNVDMKIVQLPSQVDGFYDLAREFSQSYLGDAKNPQFANQPAQPEIPADCSLARLLKAPNIQKWDPALGEYVDAKGRFLHWDDLFKGWPFP